MAQSPQPNDYSEQEKITSSNAGPVSLSVDPGENDKPDPDMEEKVSDNRDNDYMLANGNDKDSEKDESVEMNHLVNKIFFEFDSVEISPDYIDDLNNTAAQLHTSADIKALIIGYSDSVGDKEYNLDLSMKRANAVASYLGSQGVPADRLDTDGRGIRHTELELDSMTDSMTPNMYRLVEIYLIEPEN